MARFLEPSSFVIDASVAIAGFSESHGEAASIVDRAMAGGCHAPVIWPFEVENVLALKARRKIISTEEYSRALRAVRDLRAKIDDEQVFVSIAAARPLSHAHNLTIYDASYLELAYRLRLPLATLDRRLAAAASRENIELLASA